MSGASKDTDRSKTSGETQKTKGRSKKMDAAVIIAIVGAVSTIVVALINSPFWVRWLELQSSHTPVPSQTASATDAASATPWTTWTDTPSPTFPVSTDTPPVTELVTVPAVPSKTAGMMVGSLRCSLDVGKAPFSATFNAEDSVFYFPDGTAVSCRVKNTCSYFWSISFNGKILITDIPNTGVISYPFTRKGIYTVAVTVCRGEICDTDSESITAK